MEAKPSGAKTRRDWHEECIQVRLYFGVKWVENLADFKFNGVISLLASTEHNLNIQSRSSDSWKLLWKNAKRPGQCNGSLTVHFVHTPYHSGFQKTRTSERSFRIFYSLEWFFWACQLVRIFKICVQIFHFPSLCSPNLAAYFIHVNVTITVTPTTMA